MKFRALIISLLCLPAQAELHYGYLDNVEEEKSLIVREMILIPKPEEGPPLTEVIFDDELTKEFNRQYEQRFGHTPGEQLIDPSNRFAVTQFSVGVHVDAEKAREEQQAYAEYMGRRLTEHHLDNYLKSSPKAKAVYELKERVSNVSIKTSAGYKFRIKYSLSANEVDFILSNPAKIRNRLTLSGDDKILYVSYPVTKSISVSSNYREKRDDLSLIGSKRWTSSFSTSLTGQQRNQEQATDGREDRILLGFTWR